MISVTLVYMSFETAIRDIIERAVKETAEAVRAELNGRFTVDAAPGRRGRPPKALPAATATRAKRPAARRYPPHCVFKGCTKPHTGPRFSFLCAEHRELPKAKRTAAVAAYRKVHP